MTPHRDAEDEAALAAFFAAARAEEEGPSVALLSAILADAAGIHADRAVAPAARRFLPAGSGWGARLLAPIGGWRGIAVLGGCAAFGFWLGLAGNLSLDGTTLTTVAASESAVTGVDAFFDLAALEQ
ncbi:hypothetical protein [Amaricoccus sp.]|uniref:hypothetical protein n=1 Tax=Amaricoccus sp. TaxID=1872485 RepID=UPI0026150CF8|nr:hypothetical protein [Amaricoccus sp.]HRO11943.1 hypothetical protein [Amaricoccus sp.]